MFGKGVSYLQQVDSQPARKVVLIPGNAAYHQRSAPTPENKSFSLLLGEPNATNEVPSINSASNAFNVYGRFKQEGKMVDAFWNVFDVVPELFGDYYLRVEQIQFTLMIKRDDPSPIPSSTVRLESILEYSTSLTTTDLTPSADRYPLQHNLLLDSYMVYPTTNYTADSIKVKQVTAGTALYGLRMYSYTDTSFTIGWNNGMPGLPDVTVFFKGSDGRHIEWTDRSPTASGYEVTVSGFSDYPVDVYLQEVVDKSKTSETIQLYNSGDQKNGSTEIKAVYRLKEPFVPEAPMMVDRVRDSMFMRKFGIRIACPRVFVGVTEPDYDANISRVKMALYPMGARYDIGSHA
jgi:hypothetical protein